MQRVLLIGLSHATAPLELRERLAFSDAQRRAAVERFAALFPESEVVLLSTCNRVEIYAARAVHGHPRAGELLEFLCDFHGVDPRIVQAHRYEKTQRDAVEHLFRVTAGLESMAAGESQILGQVRQAYELSSELRRVGATLNPLFQRAIAAAKEAQTLIPPKVAPPSIATLAVAFSRRAIGPIAGKSVLAIGAGEMMQIVLSELAPLKPAELIVCNRDESRARAAAVAVQATPIPLARLPQVLPRADLVITCTAAENPLLTRQDFQRAAELRSGRETLVIDLGVPRDVEPAVRDLQNIQLCDLDDLQSAAQAIGTFDDRLERAARLIDEHVESYLAWQHARALGPAIEALYRRFQAVADEESSRAMGRLGLESTAQRDELRELTRRIVNKLLHDPVTALREGSSPDASYYLNAMRKLFALDVPDETG